MLHPPGCLPGPTPVICHCLADSRGRGAMAPSHASRWILQDLRAPVMREPCSAQQVKCSSTFTSVRRGGDHITLRSGQDAATASNGKEPSLQVSLQMLLHPGHGEDAVSYPFHVHTRSLSAQPVRARVQRSGPPRSLQSKWTGRVGQLKAQGPPCPTSPPTFSLALSAQNLNGN